MTGNTIGPYHIVAKLGEGGMGEVYHARDPKLNRGVAIKVLLAAVGSDPERLARFSREAQVLASLNHPNIAHIHGLEQSDAGPFLVMELVEGPTLADRIARGPLPLDEALAIARQIADALEAAHERGIVHRDLKPANIKVRDDGTVKVLDFGLAKAIEGAGAVAPDSAANSPTITTPPAVMTGVGVILGTAAYMSPEQAKGQAADKRSDVWAFGCVLYEMLAGTRAFGGDGVPLVLATVMTQTPDWSALPDSTPPGVRRLLRRCLEKNPRRRLQAIGDARIEIEDALAGQADQVARQPAQRVAPWWRRIALPAAAAVAMSVAAAGVGRYAARPPAAQPRVSRLNIAATGAAAISIGVSRDIAITPDGSRLVYVGANGTTLFVRPLDQLEATALVRGAALRHPFISPDGRWVGFFDGNLTLKKVAITGGPALLVARLDSFERGATWVSDATIVLATQSTALGLQSVSADGGTPRVLTRPDRVRGEAGHAWPETLPDGQAILYSILPTSGGLDAASIAVLDLRSGRSTTLIGGGTHAQYSPSGQLLFGTAGTLRAIGFDTKRLAVAGESAAVVPTVKTTLSGGVDAVLARDGTLVYVVGTSGAALRSLASVDRQGRETPIGAPRRAYYFPRVSPDGTRVAVNAVVDQNSDIWTWDLGRATLTRVTSDPAQDAFPMWTRDGRRLVIGSNRAGVFNLFQQAADGTGAVERLTDSRNPQYPSDTTPDGRNLVFTEMSGTTAYDVMMLALDGSHHVTPLVQSAFDERNGVVSPDGRWLAYEANDTGTFEIYVRPFSNLNGGHWQVSTAGGIQPRWAPGGRELVYFAPDGALMHVAVVPGTTWAAAAPTKVLDAHYVMSTGGNLPQNYDISPDGQHFVMLKEESDAAGAPPQIVVVEHFDEELKRLVPAKRP